MIPTISALVDFLLRALTPYAIRQVRVLHHLWDFKGWMAPHLSRISGYATTQQSDGMHEMYITRDARGRARVVFRQSSQSSTWLPEGPGELVFMTLPDGQPPDAEMLSDAAWSCDDVKGNVRRWLQQIVGGSALGSAEREWEKTFHDMPANGDVSLINRSLRLEWPSLPRGAHTAASEGPSDAMGAVDMIENPDVNPIQGQFRTYDDVRRELEAHQRSARAAAVAAGSRKPIFRSEYVFFTGNGGKPMLGRVCNVPPGKGDDKDVTVDMAEYTHHPPPGLDAMGFLGFFEPSINARYNPNQAGSKKFLRHYGLPRADLLVLDVQTFTASKKLYVQTASLRLLEKAYPRFKLPAQLPALHRRNGGTGTAAGGGEPRDEAGEAGDSSDANDNDCGEDRASGSRHARMAASASTVGGRASGNGRGRGRGAGAQPRRGAGDGNTSGGAGGGQTRIGGGGAREDVVPNGPSSTSGSSSLLPPDPGEAVEQGGREVPQKGKRKRRKRISKLPAEWGDSESSSSLSLSVSNKTGSGSETEKDESESDSSAQSRSAARPPPQQPRLQFAQLRSSFVGRRVLVPRDMWPNEPCSGKGWPGLVRSVSREHVVRVEVDQHRYAFPLDVVQGWAKL